MDRLMGLENSPNLGVSLDRVGQSDFVTAQDTLPGRSQMYVAKALHFVIGGVVLDLLVLTVIT